MAHIPGAKSSSALGFWLVRQGEHMHSVCRQHLLWWGSLFVLCWAPLAFGQQLVECRRDCDSEYWKAVSICYRSNTLYNDVRQCQETEQTAKRACKHQCSRPKAPEPRDCRRRCDRQYWDARSLCYQSSNRASEISKCDTLARGTKNQCTRGCPRPSSKQVRR